MKKSSLDANLIKKYHQDIVFNYDDYPSDMKFRIIEIATKDEFYDVMQFYYIPNDKKFIIHSLNGRKDYNNINDCYNKKQRGDAQKKGRKNYAAVIHCGIAW